MENIIMNNSEPTKIFFTKFFREFRAGLRSAEQPLIDQLIEDLTDLSLIIPPSSLSNQYNFREILMLIILVNQMKIKALSTKE